MARYMVPVVALLVLIYITLVGIPSLIVFFFVGRSTLPAYVACSLVVSAPFLSYCAYLNEFIYVAVTLFVGVTVGAFRYWINETP